MSITVSAQKLIPVNRFLHDNAMDTNTTSSISHAEHCVNHLSHLLGEVENELKELSKTNSNAVPIGFHIPNGYNQIFTLGTRPSKVLVGRAEALFSALLNELYSLCEKIKKLTLELKSVGNCKLFDYVNAKKVEKALLQKCRKEEALTESEFTAIIKLIDQRGSRVHERHFYAYIWHDPRVGENCRFVLYATARNFNEFECPRLITIREDEHVVQQCALHKFVEWYCYECECQVRGS